MPTVMSSSVGSCAPSSSTTAQVRVIRRCSSLSMSVPHLRRCRRKQRHLETGFSDQHFEIGEAAVGHSDSRQELGARDITNSMVGPALAVAHQKIDILALDLTVKEPRKTL